MTTHSIRIKAIVLSIVFILCVVVVPCTDSKADSFPSEFYLNSQVYYSASEIFNAYIELNYTQKEICAYLLGMYNLMALGARGFSFRQGAYHSESEFIAKLKSFGYRFLQGAAEIALKSRMDDEFCKYASACILYSSQCNVADFDTWFSNLDEDFVLPVDQGIINSFMLLYNDNSVEGIETYGDIENPWESGNYNTYPFEQLPFANANSQTKFSDFVTDNFVAFSSVYTYDGTNNSVIGFKYDEFAINAIYILRGETYNYFRFGRVDESTGELKDIPSSYQNLYCYINRGAVTCTNYSMNSRYQILSGIQTSDLSDFIESCIHQNPFNSTWDNWMTNNYPYIRHVFLVDNLDTRSNPQEVFNTDSFDIIGGDPLKMIVPIDKVDIKPKVITTINLPDNSGSTVSIQDIITDDNTVDDNGNPVDPWQITIVVQPNDTNPISVSVNLFTGAKSYVRYLWESSEKFIKYSATLLNCFEFEDSSGKKYGPKIALLGVVTLGIAGGLIAKFLL